MDQVFDGLLKVSPDVVPLGFGRGILWVLGLVGALGVVGVGGVLAKAAEGGFVATAGWLAPGFWLLGHVELRFFRAISPELAWGHWALGFGFFAVTVALAFAFARVMDADEIGFGIGVAGGVLVLAMLWYDGKLEAARYQPPGVLGFLLGAAVAVACAYAILQALRKW